MNFKKLSTVFVSVAFLFVIAQFAIADEQKQLTPKSSFDVRHDISLPWRNIPQKGPEKSEPNKASKPKLPPGLVGKPKPSDAGPDPVKQPFGTAATPAPSSSFEGLSDDDNAATIGGRFVPPDTNGDVGPNHYVQFINAIVAVYDKSGARTFGPVPGNSIWSGFGGICETNNDGDTVVLYDHLSDRWVLSQFAIGSSGHQCIAVSTTGDPAGAYHRYDFNVSPNAFNDYPKLGVWRDGYYLTANQFSSGFDGAIAVAFERDRMIRGQSAQMVKFVIGCGADCFFSVLPSHLNGPAPAVGTPNTFVMSFDADVWGNGANSDGYRLWNFKVNWQNPSNSTFTSLGQVNAPEFDANMCNFSANCITQPAPGEKLDTLSQFTMYRAQFRHFSDRDSIVLNHTVDATGKNLAGVRWVELRKTGGSWTLYQTGTISPDDGNHRWMGSAAMDKNGNIAVGYSISSKQVTPSIRYATRLATDPLGTLNAEAELHAGTGVQQQSVNRWGDYSSMSVDPAGCTFWFTSEYYANNGSFDFKTRIGSFTIPGCQ